MLIVVQDFFLFKTGAGGSGFVFREGDPSAWRKTGSDFLRKELQQNQELFYNNCILTTKSGKKIKNSGGGPNMEQQTRRLVTRSDFDSLACAMMLKELKLIDEIVFVHPKDVQDGKVELSKNDITTNLPYAPGCPSPSTTMSLRWTG